jgi:hypothetical protein
LVELISDDVPAHETARMFPWAGTADAITRANRMDVFISTSPGPGRP